MNSNEFKDKLTSVAPEVPEHFHNRVENDAGVHRNAGGTNEREYKAGHQNCWPFQ